MATCPRYQVRPTLKPGPFIGACCIDSHNNNIGRKQTNKQTHSPKSWPLMMTIMIHKQLPRNFNSISFRTHLFFLFLGIFRLGRWQIYNVIARSYPKISLKFYKILNISLIYHADTLSVVNPKNSYSIKIFYFILNMEISKYNHYS